MARSAAAGSAARRSAPAREAGLGSAVVVAARGRPEAHRPAPSGPRPARPLRRGALPRGHALRPRRRCGESPRGGDPALPPRHGARPGAGLLRRAVRRLWSAPRSGAGAPRPLSSPARGPGVRPRGAVRRCEGRRWGMQRTRRLGVLDRRASGGSQSALLQARRLVHPAVRLGADPLGLVPNPGDFVLNPLLGERRVVFAGSGRAAGDGRWRNGHSPALGGGAVVASSHAGNWPEGGTGAPACASATARSLAARAAARRCSARAASRFCLLPPPYLIPKKLFCLGGSEAGAAPGATGAPGAAAAGGARGWGDRTAALLGLALHALFLAALQLGLACLAQLRPFLALLVALAALAVLGGLARRRRLTRYRGRGRLTGGRQRLPWGARGSGGCRGSDSGGHSGHLGGRRGSGRGCGRRGRLPGGRSARGVGGRLRRLLLQLLLAAPFVDAHDQQQDEDRDQQGADEDIRCCRSRSHSPFPGTNRRWPSQARPSRRRSSRRQRRESSSGSAWPCILACTPTVSTQRILPLNSRSTSLRTSRSAISRRRSRPSLFRAKASSTFARGPLK